MPTDEAEPRSPCVRNCCLDADAVCLGCGRHIDEIVAWHSADAEAKRAILERARVRRESRGRQPR